MKNSTAQPRVLLVSQRNISNQVANAALYELEDLVCSIDDVDLVAPSGHSELSRKLYKLVRLCGGSRGIARTATLRPNVTVPRDRYQLLFAVFDHQRQVTSVHRIKELRSRCDKAICFVGEMWPTDLYKTNMMLELFDLFDHVFIGVENSSKLFSKMTGIPCSSIPQAVDVLKLAPTPAVPRCIDICSIGRRSDVTHRSLLALAEREALFYYFDTLQGPLRFNDYQEHRLMFSNILKRSRYFIANYGKFDRPDQTTGVQEVGGRFFEGAAAGTVMIGRPPANDAFKRLFPWQDAVIEAPIDAPDIADLIHQLDVDQERTVRMRTANVVNALRRHDWLYRYEAMLATVGVDKSPAMAERRERLEGLADQIESGVLELVPRQTSNASRPTDAQTRRRMVSAH